MLKHRRIHLIMIGFFYLRGNVYKRQNARRVLPASPFCSPKKCHIIGLVALAISPNKSNKHNIVPVRVLQGGSSCEGTLRVIDNYCNRQVLSCNTVTAEYPYSYSDLYQPQRYYDTYLSCLGNWMCIQLCTHYDIIITQSQEKIVVLPSVEFLNSQVGRSDF